MPAQWQSRVQERGARRSTPAHSAGPQAASGGALSAVVVGVD